MSTYRPRSNKSLRLQTVVTNDSVGGTRKAWQAPALVRRSVIDETLGGGLAPTDPTDGGSN